MRWVPFVMGLTASAVLGACSGPGDTGGPSTTATQAAYRYPRAPVVRVGGDGLAARTALNRIVDGVGAGFVDQTGLDQLVASGDARQAWFVADLLRFYQGTDSEAGLVVAFATLTGVDPSKDPHFADSSWGSVTDHLITWNLPAASGYREAKGRLFTLIEPGWKPFFDDAASSIDWRIVSWGGVNIDDRPSGSTEQCARGCIPALDDPKLTNAEGGSWYPDSSIVFGVVEGDEAVAFPKNIMEVHEMVNTTIGGRRLAIPYCTLCGSAQAYFTDRVAGITSTPLLRTSGLLSRSNKVMYDLNTHSVFDTFTGQAISGPLHTAKVTLIETTVTTSSWGEWKRDHPHTRIVARDGGIGRSYETEPLGGRDDNGPIFPIGPRDPRLPVQEKVVGVLVPGGRPIAFPVSQARTAIGEGRRVFSGGIELVTDGSGFTARLADGAPIAAHEAFWFAWSQFHPDTTLWTPLNQ